MANQIPEEALAAIEDAVGRSPNGVSAPEILRALATPVPPRTLQYRLRHLVTRNRIIMDGDGLWARYRMCVTIQTVSERTAVSFPTASTALEKLAKIGVVREITRRQRGRTYASSDYLAFLDRDTEPLPA